MQKAEKANAAGGPFHSAVVGLRAAVSEAFIFSISDAVMGNLTRGGLQSAPIHAMPRKRTFMCGVGRDGNDSDGLLTIQKCSMKSCKICFHDGCRESFSVTFSWVMGNTGREKIKVKDW